MQKRPITVRISYEVLKGLLMLPEDVDIVGIVGTNDLDGTFPLTIETPLYHIRGGPMGICYHKSEVGQVRFDGFAPSS